MAAKRFCTNSQEAFIRHFAPQIMQFYKLRGILAANCLKCTLAVLIVLLLQKMNLFHELLTEINMTLVTSAVLTLQSDIKALISRFVVCNSS